MKKNRIWLLGIIGLLAVVSCKEEDFGVLPPITVEGDVEVRDGRVHVNPHEYTQAFRNPMKGWREFFGPGVDPRRAEYPYPYGSMIKEYMQWNMLEDKESDGVDKIIAYSDHRWEGVEDINVKVIPRIFIIWMEPWHGGYAKNTYTDNPDDLNGWHWPSDIPGETWDEDDLYAPIEGGYCHPTFQDRVKKLVAKAGEAWDNDPRVAYIEMGIIGEWGEHHDPDITTVWAPHDQGFHVENRTWLPGIEKVLGDAFTAAFKNKKVMVRYAYEFKDYEFGIYWDSWCIDEEIDRGYNAMMALGDRWKIQPMGGEITWNWGSLQTAGYNSLEDVIGNDNTRELAIDQIRALHCNHLGGVTWADFKNETFLANAGLLQRTMGYRFLLDDFNYPVSITKGQPFTVAFNVTNSGSSPFYYDWPVEIAILDAETHEPVWKTTLESPKISQWFPGDNWNTEANRYQTPAETYHVEETITLDTDLEAGNYIISVAVLDPAGMLPSLRFAAVNYFEGGRHPMGYIGVGSNPENFVIANDEFFDIQSDKTLHYVYNK